MAGERILLIDDEAGIRTSLSRVLGDEGYRVETAADGDAGLTKLAAGGFALVLLDVWLPTRDGVAILQEIRSRGFDVPVIMISGHANIDTAVRATKLGAYDFLEKPLTIEKISVVVRNALRHHRLESRNRRLRNALRAQSPRSLIGESEAIVSLRDQIARAAPTNGRVLIMGENGTGKELVARMIHSMSLRADEPFIEMNCAAIPEELIESELFGHVKGSFTGAVEDKKGKFELADQGTLFLDEIGDMSLKTQSKVLRVLQEQTFVRVGGTEARHVDVRVLAATNKDLTEQIRAGAFREDLFFRLNVIPIMVPPLRDRRGDIPALARHFISEFTRDYGRAPMELSAEAVEAMGDHVWPGNVRELRNVIERIVIMARGDRINPEDLPAELRGEAPPPDRDDEAYREFLECAGSPTLRQGRERFEKHLIRRRLAECGQNVSRAAEALGLERSHLHRKLKAYGLVPERD